MDIVYRLGTVSVGDVHREMPDPPTYSAVRALVRTLEEKGHLRHEQAGRKYVYHPTVRPESASSSALKRVVRTFFSGSPVQAALALVAEADLGDAELAELEAAIRKAREEGR